MKRGRSESRLYESEIFRANVRTSRSVDVKKMNSFPKYPELWKVQDFNYQHCTFLSSRHIFAAGLKRKPLVKFESARLHGRAYFVRNLYLPIGLLWGQFFLKS